MKTTEALSWTNWRGKREERVINLTIDIEDFLGKPGYALLVIAANPHLSFSKVVDYLRHKGVGRTVNWVQRRRWLFHGEPRLRTNEDGKDAKALAIMAANPRLSLRDLSLTLKEHGIVRGKDWVRMNRPSLSDDAP